MRAIAILVFAILFTGIVNGQKKLDPVNNAAKEIFSIPEQDMLNAKQQGFEVFKILPRGMFDFEKNEFSTRGGGAYYSFTNKSHSYNGTPQIQLEAEQFSVGFAGLDYGFITDLGEIPLSGISEQSREVEFSYNYKPPKFVSEIRDEQINRCLYKPDCGLYKKYIPAVVGHTYILRAISFEESDALVAFNVQQKNSDGSLIIFWKLLKQFEKPIALNQTDAELKTKIENFLRDNGFNNVLFEVKDNFVILRGTVPKGHMNELYKYISTERTRGIQDSLREQ